MERTAKQAVNAPAPSMEQVAPMDPVGSTPTSSTATEPTSAWGPYVGQAVEEQKPANFSSQYGTTVGVSDIRNEVKRVLDPPKEANEAVARYHRERLYSLSKGLGIPQHEIKGMSQQEIIERYAKPMREEKKPWFHGIPVVEDAADRIGMMWDGLFGDNDSLSQSANRISDGTATSADYHNMAQLLVDSERMYERTGSPKFDNFSDAVDHYKGEGLGWTDWALDRLPFIGSANQASRLLAVRMSMDRINAGGGSEFDQYQVARWLGENIHADENAWYEKVVNIATHIPAFAFEFGVTGGVFPTTARGTVKGATELAKWNLKRMIKDGMTKRMVAGQVAKNIKDLAVNSVKLMPRHTEKGWRLESGVLAQTLLNPTMVAMATQRNLIDGYIQKPEDLAFDSEGWLKGVLGEDSDTFWTAFGKGFGDVAIENLTERAGGTFINPIAGGIYRGIAKSKPGQFIESVWDKMPLQSKATALKGTILRRLISERGMKKISQVYKAGGWNGLMTEIAEERLGDILRTSTGLQESVLPDQWEDWMIEAVAFAFPGAARMAFSTLAGQGKLRADLVDKIKEVESIINERGAFNHIPAEDRHALIQEALEQQYDGGESNAPIYAHKDVAIEDVRMSTDGWVHLDTSGQEDTRTGMTTVEEATTVRNMLAILAEREGNKIEYAVYEVPPRQGDEASGGFAIAARRSRVESNKEVKRAQEKQQQEAIEQGKQAIEALQGKDEVEGEEGGKQEDVLIDVDAIRSEKKDLVDRLLKADRNLFQELLAASGVDTKGLTAEQVVEEVTEALTQAEVKSIKDEAKAKEEEAAEAEESTEAEEAPEAKAEGEATPATSESMEPTASSRASQQAAPAATVESAKVAVEKQSKIDALMALDATDLMDRGRAAGVDVTKFKSTNAKQRLAEAIAEAEGDSPAAVAEAETGPAEPTAEAEAAAAGIPEADMDEIHEGILQARKIRTDVAGKAIAEDWGDDYVYTPDESGRPGGIVTSPSRPDVKVELGGLGTGMPTYENNPVAFKKSLIGSLKEAAQENPDFKLAYDAGHMSLEEMDGSVSMLPVPKTQAELDQLTERDLHRWSEIMEGEGLTFRKGEKVMLYLTAKSAPGVRMHEYIHVMSRLGYLTDAEIRAAAKYVNEVLGYTGTGSVEEQLAYGVQRLSQVKSGTASRIFNKISRWLRGTMNMLFGQTEMRHGAAVFDAIISGDVMTREQAVAPVRYGDVVELTDSDVQAASAALRMEYTNVKQGAREMPVPYVVDPSPADALTLLRRYGQVRAFEDRSGAKYVWPSDYASYQDMAKSLNINPNIASYDFGHFKTVVSDASRIGGKQLPATKQDFIKNLTTEPNYDMLDQGAAAMGLKTALVRPKGGGPIKEVPYRTNPPNNILIAMVDNSAYKDVRGLRDRDNDFVHYWDASLATHQQFADAEGIAVNRPEQMIHVKVHEDGNYYRREGPKPAEMIHKGGGPVSAEDRGAAGLRFTSFVKLRPFWGQDPPTNIEYARDINPMQLRSMVREFGQIRLLMDYDDPNKNLAWPAEDAFHRDFEKKFDIPIDQWSHDYVVGSRDVESYIGANWGEDQRLDSGAAALKPTSTQYVRVKGYGQYGSVANVEYSINPTDRMLRKQAKEWSSVRVFMDTDGNTYSWPSTAALHGYMARALRLDVRPWTHWYIDRGSETEDLRAFSLFIRSVNPSTSDEEYWDDIRPDLEARYAESQDMGAAALTAGVSTDRDNLDQTRAQRSLAAQPIVIALGRDKNASDVRISNSIGKFVSLPRDETGKAIGPPTVWTENAFDVRAETNDDFDPRATIDALIEVARVDRGGGPQDAVHLSRIVGPDEDSDNLRPGIVIDFGGEITEEEAREVYAPIAEQFNSGFTFFSGPNGGYTGMQMQYIPEYSMGEDLPADLEGHMLDRAERLKEISDSLEKLRPGLTADLTWYDTLVFNNPSIEGALGAGTYDDYAERLEQKTPGTSETAKHWPRFSLREILDPTGARQEGTEDRAGANEPVRGVGPATDEWAPGQPLMDHRHFAGATPNDTAYNMGYQSGRGLDVDEYQADEVARNDLPGEASEDHFWQGREDGLAGKTPRTDMDAGAASLWIKHPATGERVNYLVNPSLGQVEGLMNKAKRNYPGAELRVLVDPKGDLIVWDGMDAIHADMAKGLGIPYRETNQGVLDRDDMGANPRIFITYLERENLNDRAKVLVEQIDADWADAGAAALGPGPMPAGDAEREETMRLHKEVLGQARRGETITIGSPNLHNDGRTEEQVAFHRALRQMQADRLGGAASMHTDEAVAAEGEIRISDPNFDKAKWMHDFQERAANYDTLNNVEVYMAKRISSEMFVEPALATGDEGMMADAMRVSLDFYFQKSEMSRAFRQLGHMGETAAERRKAYALSQITLPHTRVHGKMMKLKGQIAGAVGRAERERLQLLLDKLIEKEAAKLKQIKESIEHTIGKPFDQITDEEWDNIEFVSRVLRKSQEAKSSAVDWVFEWWMNSILSGITTQSANVIGNTGFAVWENTIQRTAEILVNNTLGFGIGGKKQKQLGPQVTDFIPILKGVLPNFVKALGYTWRSFVSGEDVYADELQKEGASKIEVANRGVAIPSFNPLGKLGIPLVSKLHAGYVVRTPTRLLSAMDNFFKYQITEMMAAVYAARLAKAGGYKGNDGNLEGDALAKEIENLLADKTSPVWDQAWEEARRLTFQSDLGAFGRTILRWRAEHPWTQFIFPFVTTPLNIFKIGVRKSPLGTLNWGYKLLTGRYKGDRDAWVRDTAEQMLAWTAFWVIMTKLMPDEEEGGLPWITGSRPSDYKEATLKDRVLPATSFRVPWMKDRWFNYNRIEPFAVALATSVDGINAYMNAENGQDAVDAMGKAWGTLVNQVRDKTFLRGLSDLLRAVEQPEQRAVSWVSNFGTSFVPNIYRSISREGDEPYRDQRFYGDWNEAFWQRAGEITNYKAQLDLAPLPPPRYNLWGEPIERQGPFDRPKSDHLYRMILPMQVRDQKLTFERSMDRMLLNWNNQNPDSPKYPTQTSRFFQWKKKRYIIEDPGLYAHLSKVGGELGTKILQRYEKMFDPANPTEKMMKKLTDSMTKGRTIARKRLLISNLRQLVEEGKVRARN